MAYKLKNNAIEKMFLNKEFADVHFVFNVNGKIQKLPANKVNLAILSPVFRTMFIGSLKKKEDVPIADADVDGFKEFLQFFYLGEVTLTMENMKTVVRLAEKYDVLDYVNAPFLLSQLTLDKMCWGYQLAVSLKNEELIAFCEDKITTSPREVFATNVFERCDKSILKRILELNLNCMEIDVFDACLAWAKYACKKDGLDETQAVNLKAQLGDCLKMIRFGSMKSDEFCVRYISHRELFTSEEFEDIMLSLSVPDYEPKIFIRVPRQHTWNEANALKCQRNSHFSGSAKFIKSLEVTSFSSSHNVFLRKFYTSRTHSELSSIVGLKIEVTITEQKDLQFNEAPKILYKGTSETWGGDFAEQLIVTLPQPILIKPRYMYEIHLKLPATKKSYYYSDCKAVVEMADGIKIEFHRNPNLKYNNLALSWITDLFFNKM